MRNNKSNSIKKGLLAIVLALLLAIPMLFTAIGQIPMGGGSRQNRGVVEVEASTAFDLNANTLFNENGMINTDWADGLMSRLLNAGICPFTGTADAQQLRAAAALGTSPLNLFTTYLAPGASLPTNNHTSVHANRTTTYFTHATWHPMFLNNGILTLWMVNPFMSPASAHNLRSAYVGSARRSLIIDSFTQVLSRFQIRNGGMSTDIHEYIVPAGRGSANMSTGLPVPNPGTGTTAVSSTANVSTFANDLVWLPSVREVMPRPAGGGITGNGMWNAIQAHRGSNTAEGHLANDRPVSLRCNGSGTGTGQTAMIIGWGGSTSPSTGDAISQSVTSGQGHNLRPALHLNIADFLAFRVNASHEGELATGQTVQALGGNFRPNVPTTPQASLVDAQLTSATNNFSLRFDAGAGRLLSTVTATVGTQTLVLPVLDNVHVEQWTDFTTGGGRARAFVADYIISPENPVPRQRAIVLFENIANHVTAVANVARPRSTNARLSTLSISVNGVVRPFVDLDGNEIPFDPTETLWAIDELQAEITAVNITAVAQCNGPNVAMGRPVCACSDQFCQGATIVGAGPQTITGTENIFTVIVTAEDGETVIGYTIMIGRQDLADNANLGIIEVVTLAGPLALSQDICNNTGDIIFSGNLAAGTTSVVLNIETESDTASIIQGGGTVWQNLTIGENIRNIVIRSQRGTEKSYILRLTVASDPVDSAARLHSLWVTGAPFGAPFASNTPGADTPAAATPIIAQAAFVTDRVTVNAHPRGTATVSIMPQGGSFQNTRTLEVDLITQTTIVIIRVTSGDETASEYYSVQIQRGTASQNALLSNLGLGGTDVNIPNFDPNDFTPTVTVPFDVARTFLYASSECPFAEVTIVGGTITGNVWFTELAVGDNHFLITVTSQCENYYEEYELLIIRQDGTITPPTPPTEADLAALLLAITEVGEFIITDGHLYTAPSVTVMQGAVNHGQSVWNRPVTQTQVNSATQRIRDAHAARVRIGTTPDPDVDKAALQGLVNTAITVMIQQRELVTVSSGRVVDDAIRVGQLVLENEYASQAQVNAAFTNLERALVGLTLRPPGGCCCSFPPGIDRAALLALMNQVSNHLNAPLNRGRYTLASISLIDSAMISANNAYWDVASTQVRINLAYTQLRNAFNARQDRGQGGDIEVDKTALRALLDQAAQRMEDYPTTYTLETTNAVFSAIFTGEDVYANDAVTQAMVDAARSNLQSALDALQRRDGRPGPTGVGGVWGRLANIWTGLPWVLFVALPILLLLIILAIILGVVLTRRRRASEEEELDANGVPISKARLNDLRTKARDAINKAFSELKYAGECVTYCDQYYSQEAEKTAMDQLVKTDKCMATAEELVLAYLAEKKAQANAGQKGKKKKKRVASQA